MPSTDKRPLKIFLCHAHADRDPVRALYVRLTKDGVDTWFDKAKLLQVRIEHYNNGVVQEINYVYPYCL